MDIIEARALVATLHHFPRRGSTTPIDPLRAELRAGDARVALPACKLHEREPACWVTVDGGRIVFTGGRFGEHSLDVRVSSRERVLAHWAGYCEANDAREGN